MPLLKIILISALIGVVVTSSFTIVLACTARTTSALPPGQITTAVFDYRSSEWTTLEPMAVRTGIGVLSIEYSDNAPDGDDFQTFEYGLPQRWLAIGYVSPGWIGSIIAAGSPFRPFPHVPDSTFKKILEDQCAPARRTVGATQYYALGATIHPWRLITSLAFWFAIPCVIGISYFGIRNRRRKSRNHCLHCDYPLAGNTCPECGRHK